ncbi:hypothetical protein SAMN05443287_11650 [Micromonospora phaseoli]|uniref:Uncharacterized protein n=1 Tax=Micromonospora phaseoli TaxID=1144548 RepID=A0A1H7DQH8_9ACTN|nr:hypothetical protein [Micromonospora phaseoli]PZV89997.1 hypothetical protein CLV64_11484 [Micromonospora phaseoli]SEK04006.1 hypothetical protein SAMN05443287_11650 [Micromonospora phaseoli]
MISHIDPLGEIVQVLAMVEQPSDVMTMAQYDRSLRSAGGLLP